MKEHIIYQRLYGLFLMSSFIFLSDMLSLKGKKLDFYERGDTYVSLNNTIPELSRFTACIDLAFMDNNSRYWTAFSYIANNTLLGRENIDLGLAGDHQQLILYNLGKTFYIHYHLTPFQWHTVCLIWDGVKGRLEIFLNKERILVVTDQPQNLTPNGTLVLGHFLKNGDSQVKSMVPSFPGSLYYFQLWDHILENEEFMKCLDGNVVSWEEDVWLVNKIIPTVDKRLRCFVSENVTIQETSTTLSQQTDLTTPARITGLKPQKTAHSSTVLSKSMPIFATDYTTISYLNTTFPPLETTTAPKTFRISIAETATLTADVLSTSASVTLPIQNTSIDTTTNSLKITKSPSSESTKTTKMAEAKATETFHPNTATNFLSTFGFTNNSIVSKTLAIESQSAVMKTTSLVSTIESMSMSTASWPKYKSTDIWILPVSTAGQKFLASTAAETVPWSTVEETSATTALIGTASAFPPESVLISTAAPADSVFPRNQTASTLATTDAAAAFTVHSVTLPTRLVETTPALGIAETELTSTNFRDVSSSRVEDVMSTSTPKNTSSMAHSFITSFMFTETQSVKTVIGAETTHTALTSGITLAPIEDETMLSPTITGPVYTQKTPTAGEHMHTLISTRLASKSKVSESVPTSTTDEAAYLFSTNETIWTSRPDQTLLTSMNTTTMLTFVPNENFTSAFHGSNTEHSSTTTDIITPPEAATESEATTTTDATTTRYTTALSKLTSPWFAKFSTVSGTTSVTNMPEFKFTTLLFKTIPMSTVAENELHLTPGETVVSPVDIISTLADIKQNFSTEESASETTQMEKNGTIAFGDTTAPIAKSTTTQRFNSTVARKETTSHNLKGKSTVAAVTEVSPFSTMLEVTDDSAQMVTASVTVSPFPDIEKLTTPLNNKTATTEVRGSWLSTKLVKTTPKSSYNKTTEIFNSTHTYTAHWTSEISKGTSTPSPTSRITQIFPEPLGASTSRILETSFPTTPEDMKTISLSASILPSKPTAVHSSATLMPVTHMFSLPVNVSAVVSEEVKRTMSEPSTLAKAFTTSMLSGVSNTSSTTVTTALVPPLDQTASVTSDTMPTHRDLIHTTSQASVISVRMTPMAVPSLTETSLPSLKTPTLVTAKAETTVSSTSVDKVIPSTHTLVCSKSPLNNIPIVSSTHVISTTSTPGTTQPISQVEKTSTYALSFPYTFSAGGDVSLATGTTETPVVDETMFSHTSANELTTSVDGHISQSATHLVNTPISSQLLTGTSILPSDKDQMTSSLVKTPKTMEVTEISPSKNSFISHSQGTSSLEMTGTGFYETTKISIHQTHSPSEVTLGTPPDGNSASSPTSGSTQTTPTLTSSNTVDVDISEMSTSSGKLALPSQSLTITTFLPPEKESKSALSVYTPRTVEMIVTSTSVTHPVSYHQDTSFVDTTTSRTTRISNPVNITTTLSHLPSLRTQPKVTSVASSISESTQTFPESSSLSTIGLYNANFTMISTDRITPALSVPNVPTTLLRETSVATSIPIYQMSSLPVNVTVFTSKNASDTPTILISRSSKTTHPDCLKSPSIVTSGPMSEMSSMPVNDSVFSSTAVSSDISTIVGSFSTRLSSITPRTTITIQTSTLDITPVTYAEPTSKSTMVSSALTTSEMIELPSRITPTSSFSPTEPTFSSMKTIPTTIMAGTVTPFIGTTPSYLHSSKNAEAISSISKTTFSPFLLTTQHSSQGDEATTLGILPGITNSSLSAMSSSRVAAITNTSVSNAPHVITSSTVEVSKSTFLTSDTIPMYPFANLTTLPFPTVSTILTQTTPSPTMGSITTGFPTSLPISIKITDNNVYISTSPEASTRTTVTTNSRTVSQPPFFSGMSMSPSTTDHTLSVGSMPLPSPTITSAWSRLPVTAAPATLIFPKPTLDSLLNIITTTSAAPGTSFPLISTGVTHPSTTTVSSLVSSSFEATWLDSTSSFVSMEASTLPIAAKSTVSFYNTEMSFSVYDEEPRIPITSVINEFTKNWLNSVFQDSEFSITNLIIQIKSRDISEEEMTMDRATSEQREGQGMATISHVLYSCVCQVIIKANSSLAPTELISRIKSQIHGNFTHGNLTQAQLTLLVKSEHVAVKKLDPGKCKADETASKYKGTYKWPLTNPTETAQTRCIKNEDGTATRICSISVNTGKAQWEKPRFKQCKLLPELPDKIVDLADITISDGSIPMRTVPRERMQTLSVCLKVSLLRRRLLLPSPRPAPPAQSLPPAPFRAPLQPHSCPSSSPSPVPPSQPPPCPPSPRSLLPPVPMLPHPMPTPPPTVSSSASSGAPASPMLPSSSAHLMLPPQPQCPHAPSPAPTAPSSPSPHSLLPAPSPSPPAPSAPSPHAALRPLPPPRAHHAAAVPRRNTPHVQENLRTIPSRNNLPNLLTLTPDSPRPSACPDRRLPTEHDELPCSNPTILRIIERAGHKMEFSGRAANMTASGLALAVMKVDHTFEGMTFSICSYREGTDPECFFTLSDASSHDFAAMVDEPLHLGRQSSRKNSGSLRIVVIHRQSLQSSVYLVGMSRFYFAGEQVGYAMLFVGLASVQVVRKLCLKGRMR
nr:adhesion G-protein coupled receptor G4 [Microcebus murinus]